ncbi:helix-turn-helix domain-containing protein [Arcobacter vandammei]|uniref:helix-turn-helix domain-containing protein n=1 Tax=Arcobacter vandammei TaxID=2782243 RepID=UPI0018DFB242|nr:helix-turn-helix domain-containing protein [Arcobacter vandammei]
MIELKTPFEIIEELSLVIEKTRINQNLRQKDLCKNAGVSISTYQNFLYDKKISITSLVKIMYSLDMHKNLSGLISYDEIKSLEDIKRAKKEETKPQRVRLKEDE